MLTEQQDSSRAPSRETSPRLTIYTVGHGTRTLAELIEILQGANITQLVDVRSIPRSFTNPQFNQDALSSSTELQAGGIKYQSFGEKLGGLRKKLPGADLHTALRVKSFRNYAAYMSTPTFGEGLDELKDVAERHASDGGKGTAIMCSETLWWRCHRRMIADALVARGLETKHLGLKPQPVEHVLWEIAKLDDDGNLIYNVKEKEKSNHC